jgi:hypothetical protein
MLLRATLLWARPVRAASASLRVMELARIIMGLVLIGFRQT